MARTFTVLSEGRREHPEHDCALPGRRETKKFAPMAEIRCDVCGDVWFASPVWSGTRGSELMWVRDRPFLRGW